MPMAGNPDTETKTVRRPRLLTRALRPRAVSAADPLAPSALAVTLRASAVAVGWLLAVLVAKKRDWVASADARKLLHIGIGLLFVWTWPWCVRRQIKIRACC